MPDKLNVMIDTLQRDTIKEILDRECFEVLHFGLCLRRNIHIDNGCWLCHRNDKLTNKIQDIYEGYHA